MKLVSTRDASRSVSLREGVLAGLAPDGGLYLPERWPQLSPAELESLRGRSFLEVARTVALRLFEETLPRDRIETIVEAALDLDIPLIELSPDTYVLELFHGPTGSFKDTGARFLSRLLPALEPSSDRPVLVVVATSGDTGGAVTHAFRNVEGARAVVLFPKGRVSAVQYEQIVSGGVGDAGVRAVSVEGSFDDCQRLVKESLADGELARKAALTSANSINIGRLLPQIFHFVHAWAQLDRPPRSFHVSVPTGNVGHLVSGVMAQRMGLPVTGLMAATNANDGLVRYIMEGETPSGPSRQTLSNAMDVAIPSNLERLIALFDGDRSKLGALVSAASYTDEDTLRAIEEVHRSSGYLIDPHTAVGWLGLQELRRSGAETGGPKVVLATAHPAKFPDVVEQATGVWPSRPEAWDPFEAGGAGSDAVARISPRMSALRPILDGVIGE